MKNGTTAKILIGLVFVLVSTVWAITWGVTRADVGENRIEIKAVRELQADQYASIQGRLGLIMGALNIEVENE